MPSLFVASIRISNTAQIGDDVIVNADVNPAAGIEFSKLDYAAFDVDLTPDVNVTRSIGTGAKALLNLYTNRVSIQSFLNSPAPLNDDAQDLGDTTHNFRTVYTNAIEGGAKALIMAGL